MVHALKPHLFALVALTTKDVFGKTQLLAASQPLLLPV
jgi:hypothetical protein